MAHIQVTKDSLGKKRIKPLANYSFLAKFPVCELVIGEFSVAASNYPIFFIERDGGYAPIALLSLLEGENLFVEADGSWSGPYLPAAFRRYPFSVGPGQIDGKDTPVLMIDEDMLSDDQGVALFGATEAEDVDSPVGRVIRLIAETDRHHQATRTMSAELAAMGLIRPADLTIDLLGQKHTIGGLLGVDEAALQALPDEDFLKLRKSGALAMAHIQMHSVGQIQRLIRRHTMRAEAERAGETPKPPRD